MADTKTCEPSSHMGNLTWFFRIICSHLSQTAGHFLAVCLAGIWRIGEGKNKASRTHFGSFRLKKLNKNCLLVISMQLTKLNWWFFKDYFDSPVFIELQRTVDRLGEWGWKGRQHHKLDQDWLHEETSSLHKVCRRGGRKKRCT